MSSSGTLRSSAIPGATRWPVVIGKRTQKGTRPGKLANEDQIMDFASPFGPALLLADGMGGHGNGDLASAIVVSNFRETLLASSGIPVEEAMKYALRIAHAAVIRSIEQHGLVRGAGSTVVVAIIQEDALWVGHVGDSRCYLFRDNRLQQITRDHSVIQAEIDAQRLTEREAIRDPRASTLTRAVGATEGLELEIAPPTSLLEGDGILLCSDGLHGFCDQEAIRWKIQESYGDPHAIARELVGMASGDALRSDDDISVIYAQVGRFKASAINFQEGRSEDTGARKQASALDPAAPAAGTASATDHPSAAPASADRTEFRPFGQSAGWERHLHTWPRWLIVALLVLASSVSGALVAWMVRPKPGAKPKTSVPAVGATGTYGNTEKNPRNGVATSSPRSHQNTDNDLRVALSKEDWNRGELADLRKDPKASHLSVNVLKGSRPVAGVGVWVRDEEIRRRLMANAANYRKELREIFLDAQVMPHWNGGDDQVIIHLRPKLPRKHDKQNAKATASKPMSNQKEPDNH